MTAAFLVALALAAQPQPPPQPPPEAALEPIPAAPVPLAAVPARPVVPLASLFSTDDYPAAALRAEEEGVVHFALLIGPEGRVRHCALVASSGSAALDSATCRILRSRARYRPGRDAAGRPAWDWQGGRMSWSLPLELAVHAILAAPLESLIRRADYPAAARAAREEGWVTYNIAIGADGRVTECIVTASNVSPALNLATCRLIRARARYTPARDARGNAMADRSEGRLHWTLPGRRRR